MSVQKGSLKNYVSSQKIIDKHSKRLQKETGGYKRQKGKQHGRRQYEKPIHEVFYNSGLEEISSIGPVESIGQVGAPLTTYLTLQTLVSLEGVGQQFKGKQTDKNYKYVRSREMRKLQDPRQFCYLPVPKQRLLRLKVKRDRTGMNLFWPQYNFQFTDGCEHFVSCKKKSANTTSNYYISLSKKLTGEMDRNYIGKVRSNFMGTIFNIFSQGCNPSNPGEGRFHKMQIRDLKATVIFGNQTDPQKKSRRLEVYLLRQGYAYLNLEGTKAKTEEVTLDKLYEVGENHKKIRYFINREPIWSQQLDGFMLNFNGRIRQPSSKNFILEDPMQKREVMMFGKMGEGIYTMQVSYPLTPHVAVGISLSQCDASFVCE